MATVMSPPIPYVGGIPGGMRVGKKIIVNGSVPHHEHSFSINLQTGTNINPRSNTALHLNPRLNENCIVRNSFQHHKWGSEERGGSQPLHRGFPFEIVVACHISNYTISINGSHFCEFRHRIDKHHVNTLTIEGGVQISSIRFEEEHSGGILGKIVGGIAKAAMGPHPSPPPPSGGAYPPSGGYPGGSAQPMYNPPVPFTTPITGGLHPGKMIHISGIPNPGAQRFTINLMCGPYDGSDIALHCDVRLQVGGDYNVIIRNSCQGGGWGSEERHSPYFPFMPNANFDMIIMAEHGQFKIAVNNQHLLEFHHRLHPLNRVDTLQIKGDLRLTQVRIQ